MAAEFDAMEIHPKFHKAILDWTEKNFKDLPLLEKNWSTYFGKQQPFRLVAKVGRLDSPQVQLGRFQGRVKFDKAGEMTGNMFYSARDIIKAQCSTELGSIQQHRETLDKATSPQTQFNILRIMAEELRHAYQMFWVLDNDPTWKQLGMGDVGEETMEQLLAMETGSHVLDAFNIDFNDFLDNLTYATIIDLVGKYQLTMQRVFSYAPMAKSMLPMLSEEGFHMASGRNGVSEVAVMAAKGQGNYSVADIQKALNQWFPRGVEMFGSEGGGKTAVEFGFKDKANAQAIGEYHEEVKSIYRIINLALMSVYAPSLSRDEAVAAIEKIEKTREKTQGVSYEMLIHVPSPKFFRRRGIEEYAWQPYDVDGNLLTKDGKPYTPEQYLQYLSKMLPEKYLKGRDFAGYREGLIAAHQPKAADPWAMN